MPGFDVSAFFGRRFGGHGGLLGLDYLAHGDDWVTLTLPYAAALAGDARTGVLAPGTIAALMDVAASLAVWQVKQAFVPHATLDLRVDHLRPPVAGRAVIGRGECYRIAGALSFVRGEAHDGDPADPVAHVVGTYMTLDPAAGRA